MKKVKVKLTKWDRRQLHELLGFQELTHARLDKVQSILDARDKLDPSELEGADDKVYTLTLKELQFNEIYRIATSDHVPWPVDDRVALLYERLKEAKNSLEGKDEG